MSSWEAAMENRELYHMNKINSIKTAAENGDAEAMEILAYISSIAAA